MKWEDKRMIKGNERRNVSCTSNHVVWSKDDQFWLPRVDVWDVIKLARSKRGPVMSRNV